MFLYMGRVTPGVATPPNGASFALVSAPGAMPPPADGASNTSGLVNWHSLVLVFSYKVRPSGNCVVFHRGDRGGAAGGGAATPAAPLGLGGATPRYWFST